MPKPKQTPGRPVPVRNPNNLPTKVCPACGRAFAWRKKWERDWENVVYCSDKCRAADRGAAGK